MTRLIDADDERLQTELFTYTRYTAIDEAPFETALRALDDAQTIDAVEVVRCGECRYVETVLCPFHQGNFCYTNADYCSKGTSDANIIKGAWVELIYDGIKKTEYRCNVCGFSQNVMSKYCPSCGAYMRGGKE